MERLGDGRSGTDRTTDLGMGLFLGVAVGLSLGTLTGAVASGIALGAGGGVVLGWLFALAGRRSPAADADAVAGGPDVDRRR